MVLILILALAMSAVIQTIRLRQAEAREEQLRAELQRALYQDKAALDQLNSLRAQGNR
jgi:hypothetical protein